MTARVSKTPAAPAKTRVPKGLLKDLRSLIETARERVAIQVNAEITLLYWQIGNRIRKDILKDKRAGYGEEIVPTLSAQLEPEFGRGFNRANLFRMVQFAEVFPDEQIVVSLTRQLSWTHFVALIPLKKPLQRDFYAEMCRLERWSTRTLRAKIGGMLFERTAISKKPDELARKELAQLREEDQLTPDLVFRDPYFLDFLELSDTYSEKDLETAILREMERFLLEIGNEFAFVGRQKRITVDNEDYYIDLLFYHRRLARLVVIELKLDKFKPADKGQMELYLRWLDKHERQPSEGSPIGLILCAGKSAEHVELLQLEKTGIRVAEYLTELPPRAVLEKKLHQAILVARERLALKDESIPALRTLKASSKR
jgi:predicted nuclease of restriction endonuclease-like (RecB) superfamily